MQNSTQAVGERPVYCNRFEDGVRGYDATERAPSVLVVGARASEPRPSPSLVPAEDAETRGGAAFRKAHVDAQDEARTAGRTAVRKAGYHSFCHFIA